MVKRPKKYKHMHIVKRTKNEMLVRVKNWAGHSEEVLKEFKKMFDKEVSEFFKLNKKRKK